jgi:hypothetical protein
MPSGRGRRENHHSTANSSSPSSANWYSCDGWRGTVLPDWGKTIAHGSDGSAARPHSSPLMKLPMRPLASPTGTQGAMRSVTSQNVRPRRRANNAMAAITPSRPPWNDMPPFHTASTSSGCAA